MTTTTTARKADRDACGPPGVESFEELIDRHGPEVHRFLVNLTRNPAEADDLYQDAALKAFRAFGRLDRKANHRAWFFRIAGNAFLSDRRKHGRVDRLDELATAAIPAPTDDAAARLDAGEALARIGPMIDRLPPKQRMAMIARKQHDLGYSEIARLLGCSEAAARANVHEAVRKLRDGLGELLA
jgi:RNA polymerase sigma-70 factor (ECF subfamily)